MERPGSDLSVPKILTLYVSGGLVHAHTAYSDPKLALSDEL
jgi:hypothetical protein